MLFDVLTLIKMWKISLFLSSFSFELSILYSRILKNLVYWVPPQLSDLPVMILASLFPWNCARIATEKHFSPYLLKQETTLHFVWWTIWMSCLVCYLTSFSALFIEFLLYSLKRWEEQTETYKWISRKLTELPEKYHGEYRDRQETMWVAPREQKAALQRSGGGQLQAEDAQRQQPPKHSSQPCPLFHTQPALLNYISCVAS